MEEFVDDNGLREPFYLMQIQEKSDEIFSDNVKKQINFLELKRGNLVLMAKSSAWREEIKLRRDEIIKNVNSVIQKDIIKSIEVK